MSFKMFTAFLHVAFSKIDFKIQFLKNQGENCSRSQFKAHNGSPMMRKLRTLNVREPEISSE